MYIEGDPGKNSRTVPVKSLKRGILSRRNLNRSDLLFQPLHMLPTYWTAQAMEGLMGVFTFSKKGDEGTTSLLTGERVSKASLRPDAYGTLDEASSALGLAKVLTTNNRIREMIQSVQEDLLLLGAQLSDTSTNSRYAIGTGRTERLESWISQLQEEVALPSQFVFPGGNPASASIDLSRAIIRRAERRTIALKQAGELDSPEVHSYLNRLADFLFTLARYAEQQA